MAEVAEGLAQLLKDTIPAIPTDAATRAKSGLRGLPMGPAVRAYLLWTRFLRLAVQAPYWPTHDHLILFAGDASMFVRPGHRCGRADRAGAGVRSHSGCRPR
jgi:transketolase